MSGGRDPGRGARCGTDRHCRDDLGRQRSASGVREHLGGVRLRLVGVHAAGAVDEGEFVRVDVERGQRGARGGVRGRRVEELALRAHRHVLPRPHRQGAGEQSRHTGQQHDVVRHPGAPRCRAREPGSRPDRRSRRTPPRGTCPKGAAVRVRRALARPPRGCARRRPWHPSRHRRPRRATAPPRAEQVRARTPRRTAARASRAAACGGRPGTVGRPVDPSSATQCCSWRPSASARASRMSRSSPLRRDARSRYTAASARSAAKYFRQRRSCLGVGVVMSARQVRTTPGCPSARSTSRQARSSADPLP